MRLSLLVSLLLFSFTTSIAQTGLLPINNFGPKQYGMHSSSNWCIAQDSLGLMYFGNANGVLQYDGHSWRFIPVKNGTYVRTMQSDGKNRIYIGCYGEFGYLESDKLGAMNYVSISSSLRDIGDKFKDIIKIHCLNDKVYFQSEERIYIYSSSNELKSVLPETSFHTSFLVGNKIYVRQRLKGLYELNGQKLEFIPNSDFLANKGVFSIEERSKEQMIILTHEDGLYIMDKSSGNWSFSEFEMDEKDFAQRAKIYGAIRLQDGTFAINSLTKGVLIIDQYGKTIARINKRLGIADDDVKEVFQDKQNNLWLATNNGISMIVWSSPLTYFNADLGLEGSIHDLKRFDNRLYVATSNGLFYTDLSGSKNFQFQRIENTSHNQFWEIRIQNKQLIASGIDGLYLINQTKGERVFDKRCRSTVFDNENKVWLIAGEDGLTLLEEDWTYLRQVAELNLVIIKIVKEQSGNGNHFWISSLQYGLSIMQLDIALEAEVNYLGFPPGAESEYIYPLEYKNQILFGSTQGIFSYTDGEFILSKQFLDQNKFKNIAALVEDGQRIWMISNNRLQIYYPEKGMVNQAPFMALDNGQLYNLLPDSSHTWIGSHEGLIRYDFTDKKNYNKAFPILIRKIKASNDSLLFDGNLINVDSKLDLPYTMNSLIMEFVALYFEESSRTQYSTFLEGYDKTWSPWNIENRINYTNLPEGNYQFKVKARNVYGTEGNEATFTFVINPPWFRTWWAYTLYIILFIGSIAGYIRYRTYSLKQDKQKLEQTVKERTTEVVAQRDEILKQKQVVDKQHQEITDSINYAQRIQSSLLGSERLLRKNLKDYFAILLPRNVVSGDFYWATEFPDKSFLLVTADSTGHGVPGAIMSILNIACLKEAIEADKQTSVAQILNFTRKRIIKSLEGESEEGEGGNDGMDCCVISLDRENKTLSYAGANLPLWIVRTNELGEKNLIELKPDKMPVGRYIVELSSFKEQTIALQEGDMVYSFSDGYADQFGGPRGKKYMYRAMREMLLQNAHLPSLEQKQIYSKRFMEWKGSEEQTDDVCLIGFRV